MELKKVGSAGDPYMVRRNRSKIDAVVPSVVAVLMQLGATVYLFIDKAPVGSIVGSGIICLCYAGIGYILCKKPNEA